MKPLTYTEAKAKCDAIEARMKTASDALRRFPRGPMGLTPDAVKFSPEYRAAKLAVDRTFAELRAFNTWFVRQFKKEIKAEIDAMRLRRIK